MDKNKGGKGNKDSGGDMILFAIIAIFLVIGLASAGQKRGSPPYDTPPTPSEEYGIIKEKKSFFSGFSDRTAPDDVNIESNNRNKEEGPSRIELLEKYVSVYKAAATRREKDEEYIELAYNSSAQSLPDRIDITDWTVENNKGTSLKIGKATNLYGLSPAPNKDRLLLVKGGKVVINTGRSPIGTNFRLNKCIGYVNQFHSFTPGIYSLCPAPRDEPGLDFQSEKCYAYVRRLSSCKMPLSGIPFGIDNKCREFISKNINYIGCLQNHRDDEDFYRNEWRVYLNRPNEIWPNIRGSILIRDEFGNLITSVSYK